MPRHIYPSSYECDCVHQLHFCEGTIWEIQKVSMRKRCGIGEGSNRHAAIFDKGQWVAIFCPMANREIPAYPETPAPTPSRPRKPAKPKPRFTRHQGQVLAFIHAYTKINGRPPAEADIAIHFQITAPSAHGMVMTLARCGLISRQPGQARSIRLLIDAAELPLLE